MELITVGLISGAVAGFVSGFAGGGGGIFLAPMLIAFGMLPHVAIGTARLGAAGLSFGSFIRFVRSGEIVWHMVLPLAVLSVPAAYLGAQLVINLDGVLIERIIGIILLLASFFFVQKKNMQGSDNPSPRYIMYPVFFFARVFQAAFGAGVGLLLSVIYVKLMGMSLRQSNATKRLPGMIVIIITLIIFGLEGIIDYQVGLALMIGSFIGGYAGAHTSLSVDQKYIGYTLSIISFLFGTYLILGL